jgi:DNA-binding CsgD family transcriptional regulator
MRNRCVNQVRARLAMRAAERQKRPAQPRRSFSARARRAAVLAAQGHSRKEIAALIGVAPETISVWKRHPQWRAEIERWRALAEAPNERRQARLELESIEAASEALEQLRLLIESATKRVRTSSGVQEVPDWPARLKACRLILAAAAPAVAALHAQAGEAAPSVVWPLP